MKKLLLFTLLTAMLLAVGLCLAEGAPQVGDTVNGFTLTEIRPFDLIDAQVYRFEHDKTGAEVFYIANDDTNRAFTLTFRTWPIDDTGLPHVFEHATLSGSEKYPSKQLFFNLSYQTFNSYMNASTYGHMTIYPVASLSEAQLLKLADFYTDSCFHPMVMEDESIYREEAWRYRMNSPEDPLTIEGTVYSEMLGATNLDRQALTNAYIAGFPGSTINFSHGGNPDHIPEMTWDSLKAYHDAFYQPSNCVAYLYGELEDYGAFLALLDETFSQYEKTELVHEDAAYTPITEPVTAEYGFPTEAGSNDSHASTVYYMFICSDAEGEDELVLNTMTDLLVAGNSALSQSVQETLPYGSFACYIETTGPVPALMFTVSNVDPQDAETFKTLVDEAIADVAANGFPATLVDSVLSSMEKDTLLIRESSDVGYNSIIPNLAYDYRASGNPWGYIDYVDALLNLDKTNAEGKYAAAAAKYLAGSQTTALVTTYPVPGQKEEKDAALAAKLAEIKASMTEEEIAAIVTASTAEESDQMDSSTASMVASLTAVTKDTLPEEVKAYDINDVTGEDGIRRIDVTAGVDGIGQADILLDATGFAPEDLHYLKFLAGLAGKLPSAAHSRSELSDLMVRYLYNFNARISLLKMDGKVSPHFRVNWIATDDDLAPSYDLVRELIFEEDVDDAQSLLDAVQAMKSSLRTEINGNGYSVMVYRSAGRYNEIYNLYSYVNYLDYYAFLERAEAQLQEDPDAFISELKRVREQLKNATGAISMFAGSPDSIAVNRPLADAFLAGLNREPITPVSYDSVPVAAAREALVLDTSVQFNGVLAGLEDVGLTEYSADLDAVNSYMMDAFLYPLLRDQYGAYSVASGASEELGMYIFSYRDPNVAETFAVYDSLGDRLAAAAVDQETLDGYILSSYNYYALPAGELSGAVSAAISLLEGKDPYEPIKWMEQLKALTPEKLASYADAFRQLAANGSIFTVGGAGVVNANAERYDVILNPFGVQDMSNASFEDLPEDHPFYTVVKAAIADGFMAPLSDTAFGVDEPATVGDYLGAIFVLIGGPSGDPEGCLSFLAENGVMSADTDLSTPLTEGFAVELFTMLGGQADTDDPDHIMTRGDLANWLEGE